ncbi:MaoC family dehydratase N-terminal domain-containing protein [Streptosporangium sp. NBC_01755]|uniref:MaoC family dehydratase N-terminal domain-containing protein n=1 Tax=Streptosporangium sp. NBC_01755 TaxID=2975949 RepID=UPI002DD9FCEC|nr:MaoC family dehydratase N-terminal domain-containing protein [Streptosporangium sp. NBC_01755]WSC97222.1 MaoC family dehydratase N-terminal domain-containing protein [Streptosporangium sp. NBC_01755]
MALNRDFIGRASAPSSPYEVSRVKIKEFATAIGDDNPIYRDREAAQAAGHPDVIAPPTFPIVFGLAGGSILSDPELGLNFAMVVHGEQRFEYRRPIRAGDELVSVSTVTDIRSAGRNGLITVRSEVSTVDGESVCTTYSTIVERGGAG